MITTVSSTAALTAALSTAKSGDTILLSGGSYSSLKLTNVNFTGEVTIQSADPGNKAVFGTIEVYNSSGLTFRGLEIFSKQSVQSTSAVWVDQSDRVVFDRMDVHGFVDDNFKNDSSGITTHGSTNVKVMNSNFHDLYNGVSSGFDNGVTFSNNYIHRMAQDGIQIGGSSNVLVAQNYITDMMSFGAAHHDAIQVFNSGKTMPMKNITIVDNTYVRGEGQVVQGIFIGNETGIAYENVTISRNAIIGGAYHGITIDTVKNVTVTDNLVQGYTDMESWIRETNGTTTYVQNNDATSYIINTNTDTHTSGNDTIKSATVGDLSTLKAWQAQAGHLTVDASTLTKTLTGAVLPTPTPSSPTPTPTPAPAPTPTPAPVPATPTVSGGVALNGTDAGDSLTGGAGNDTLDGRAGNDTLTGGAGNDTYYVDSASDKVVEAAGGGTDTVITKAAMTMLGANVENGVAAGTGSQQLYGNDLGNVLTGNGASTSMLGQAGNDTLISGAGADVMVGGAGNDVFRFTALGKTPDRISDFTLGQDKLDLHPLLSSYTGTNPVADGYVKFAAMGASMGVYVDLDGAKGPAGFTLLTTLDNVTKVPTAGTDWLF